MLRIWEYEYTADSELATESGHYYQTSVFNHTYNSTGEDFTNVNMAFNLNYQFYNKGCNGCNQTLFDSNLRVDGKNVYPSDQKSINSVEIQDDTGFLINNFK